jgi:hypothetical protein
MTMLATAIDAELSDSFTVSTPVFVLYWRFRPAHPWTIEEYSQRSKAYGRFFNLLERGIEARFEAN